MKLFLTIFAAIIASAVVLAIISAMIMIGDAKMFAIIAGLAVVAGVPIMIDRVLSRLGG